MPVFSTPHEAPRPARRGDEGIAFLAVLLVITALGFLGIAGSMGTQTELQIAVQHRSAKEALSVAEAGISHAWSLIRADGNLDAALTGAGTGGAIAGMGTAATLDGDSYRFVAFGNQATDGYYVRVLDNHDESTGANDPAVDVDDRVYIESRGRVGNADRVMSALVEAQPNVPGIFGCDAVRLTGNAFVDSYDSSVAAYPTSAGSNAVVGSNADITFGNNNSILGDATAGGSVVGGGTVTGTSTDGASPLDCTVPAPCGPPYSDGTGISGSGSYNPATGALSATAHQSILLAAGTYCFSTIVLRGQATITTTDAVTINLTGNADISGGGVVNTSTLPVNLTFNSTGASFVLRGGTSAYFTFMGPGTAFSLAGNVQIYGSIFAQTVDQVGTGDIHYDASQAVANPPLLMAQREVRN